MTTRFQPWGFGGSTPTGFAGPRPGSFQTQWQSFGYGGRVYGNFDRSSRVGNFSTRFQPWGFGGRPNADFTRSGSGHDFIGPVRWQSWGYTGTPYGSFAGRTPSGRDGVGTITEYMAWGWGGRLHGQFAPRAVQIFNASISDTFDFLFPTVGFIAVSDGFNAAISGTLGDVTGSITMVQGPLTINAQISGLLADVTGSIVGTVGLGPVNMVINGTLEDVTGHITGQLGLLSNRMVINGNLEDVTGQIVLDYNSLSFMQIDGMLEDVTGQIFMHPHEPDLGVAGERSSGRVAVPTKMFDETGAYTEQGLDWINKLTSVANAVIESGPTSSRPTSGLYIGRRFYDTTLNTEIHVVSVDPVVWQNSFGNVV